VRPGTNRLSHGTAYAMRSFPNLSPYATGRLDGGYTRTDTLLYIISASTDYNYLKETNTAPNSHLC
jgi:hypothetical protein